MSLIPQRVSHNNGPLHTLFLYNRLSTDLLQVSAIHILLDHLDLGVRVGKATLEHQDTLAQLYKVFQLSYVQICTPKSTK